MTKEGSAGQLRSQGSQGVARVLERAEGQHGLLGSSESNLRTERC